MKTLYIKFLVKFLPKFIPNNVSVVINTEINRNGHVITSKEYIICVNNYINCYPNLTAVKGHNDSEVFQ